MDYPKRKVGKTLRSRERIECRDVDGELCGVKVMERDRTCRVGRQSGFSLKRTQITAVAAPRNQAYLFHNAKTRDIVGESVVRTEGILDIARESVVRTEGILCISSLGLRKRTDNDIGYSNALSKLVGNGNVTSCPSLDSTQVTECNGKSKNKRLGGC